MELFSKSNRRGLIFLLPLLAVVALLAALAERRGGDEQSVSGEMESAEGTKAESDAESGDVIKPFRFDPNTATFEEFVALVLSKSTAAGIVKYRKR